MKHLKRLTFMFLILCACVACGTSQSPTGVQPTGSTINTKITDTAKTNQWEMSVNDMRQASGSLYVAFSIKNRIDSTQILSVSRVRPTLLDENAYIVAQGFADIREPIISVPRGLKLNFEGVINPSSGNTLPKFSQIGITSDLVGVNLAFDLPTKQNPKMASDDIPTTVGNATPFGGLQLRFLGVNDRTVELGIENNSSDSIDISWIEPVNGRMLIKGMTMDEDGNIFNRGQNIISKNTSRIPANSKVKESVVLNDTKAAKLLLYDQIGHAALFKIR